MDDIYTNPRAPGSYGGTDMLRRYSHKPRKQVVIYLSTLDAYTLHKNRLGFAFHVDERFPRELQISFR